MMSEHQTLPDSPPAPSDPQDTDFVAIKVSEPPTGESHDPLSGGVDGPSTNHRLLHDLRAMASGLLWKLFILKASNMAPPGSST
ncbi:hypothetical protein RhiJN_05656 [Ceratobasidium sp. AG-Ba]|nr:hypothetical protein RhiJN_05656 [Ceratobasidium sp. AG-Ba]